jgi:hypothetical protein
MAAEAATQFAPSLLIESPSPEPEGWFGSAGVASVPNVDGTGRPGILVCASGELGGGHSGAGRVYLYDAASGTLLRELRAPDELRSREFGWAATGIADLSGDGRGDAVVASNERENLVYVFDVATGAVIYTLEPTGGPSSTVGVRSVAAVPDVNKDGRPEIVVGVAVFGSSGTAKLYDGASGALLRTLSGPFSFAESVSGLSDVNGDGCGDVAVGTWNANRAQIYDGATGTVLRTLTGSGQFGRGVLGLEDVNGDGRGDLVVTAIESSRAYIYDGSTGTRLHTLSARGSPPFFGLRLDRLPDVNGDGRDDVVIRSGQVQDDPEGKAGTYIFSGAQGTLLTTLPLYGMGYVAGLPDANGDGLGEVVVSYPHGNSTDDVHQAGQLFLHLSVEDKPRLSGFGFVAEEFKIQLRAEVGAAVELQQSEDLVYWQPVRSQNQTSPVVEFADPAAKSAVRRFYRARVVQ